MSAFSVRAAKPADHLALAEVLAELLEEQVTAALAAALNTNLLRLLSQPGAALLVAEADAALVGFVSLWTRWGLFDEAPTGLIDRLVVRRGWEGSAVPYALLEQALGACQALGCSSVEFVPAEGSLVPSSLERFGFRAVEGRYGLEIL